MRSATNSVGLRSTIYHSQIDFRGCNLGSIRGNTWNSSWRTHSMDRSHSLFASNFSQLSRSDITQVIGHNVTVIEDQITFHKTQFSLDEQFDIIFCDYHFTSRARNNSLIWTPSLRSKLRVLDTFGTQNYFNMLPVERATQQHVISTYCCLQIHPAQFYTFYPHTPENTFLGYSVLSWKYHKHAATTIINNATQTIEYSKNNQAVVWGKLGSYYIPATGYLKLLSGEMKIHGTAKGTPPAYVTNHGVLTPEEYGVLLEETVLFLGVGFPLDGPSPFEAMARGCIYVNAKFPHPINSQNDSKLRGKPTLRSYTSQHPYLEQFTSHVITIDLKNTTEVQEMIAMTKNITKFEPFIPEEFQVGNFIWRVYNLVNNQHFEAQNGTFVLVEP